MLKVHFPGSSIYTTSTEAGPYTHIEGDLVEPSSIIVAYLEPLSLRLFARLRSKASVEFRVFLLDQ